MTRVDGLLFMLPNIYYYLSKEKGENKKLFQNHFYRNNYFSDRDKAIMFICISMTANYFWGVCKVHLYLPHIKE